jgi:predicted CopG family antitoxin
VVNITISVTPELKETLEKYPEMNWSEVARQAWKRKAEQLELLNRLTAKSNATDADVEELGRMLKVGIYKRHEEAVKRLKK